MKTLLMSVYCLLLSLCTSAQISVMINPPNPLQAQTADLFNGGLTNATGASQSLYLIGSIINLRTGEKLVAATTGVRDYPSGYKQLSASFLSPSYSYAVSSVEQTGYLPYGNYRYCLNVYSALTHEELGNGCTDVEITPMSPPLLLSPDNESEITVPYPLLIWLPPSPVNTRMGVVYDLKLVELLLDQTPYDAIQRNYALLEQQNIRSTSLQYPANAMKLEEGKTYAWQVLAKAKDGNRIGETEVWTFTYKESESYIPVKADTVYGLLKKSLDGGYFTVYNRKLYFQFDERYSSNMLNMKVFDEKRKEVQEACYTGLEKRVGLNKFIWDFSQCKNIKKGGMYSLEVTNEKNEIYLLKFFVQ